MTTRVLLVDDNPQDRLLSRRALAAEFPDLHLTEVATPAQLEGALNDLAFDAVVTDYQLRWTDGLKVLERVQQAAADLPVIMFTNTGSEEIAASGLRLHLADYIVKTPGHYGRLAHGVRVALRNASERRRVEARLQERNRLLDLSYEPIMAWAIDGGITEWNAGCERLYGYSRDEALGRISHELLRTTHPIPLEQLLDILATRGEWSGELRHHARDGREIVVQSRQQLFDIDGGRLVLESNHDITAQKQAAERAVFMNQAGNVLAGSLDYEATLTAVANLAVPAIADWCAVDVLEDGKLQRVAIAHSDPTRIELARALEQYDNPAAAHSALAVTRTATPFLAPLVTREMIAVVAAGEPDGVERIESLRLTSYMCVPLVARGKPLGALTLATSDSGRRFGDEDFRFAQDVAHRAALAVDNARAYQAMAVADRMKDEFLATLSHELRTPLNAIVGYLRLLRSGSLRPERTDHAIQIVERNADALTQLVEDVLDVSRIISGKVRLTIQAVDLPRVVRDAVESVMPAADAKGIRIQVTIDPGASPISGDPDRLQQVVWNLVSNAVKFTPKGGRVQVRLERVNSHVDVTVSDTGVGIKTDVLPHVFERFRQGDSTTTRQFGGLGLGLAIVRHLTELHGGTVMATSEGEDKGATFRVRLPMMIVLPESAIEERRRHTTSRVVAPSEGRLTGVRVLAVDDDGDALSLLREVLELAGAQVTTIDRGSDAVDLIKATRPTVIIADVGLPDMDGYELIKRIRRLDDPQLKMTPAIALTAYARAEDRVRALESGFELHLAKAADPAELVAAVVAAARRER